MNRRIRVRAIKKEEPDLRLFVLALITLARQLQEADAHQAITEQAPETAAAAGQEVAHERD